MKRVQVTLELSASFVRLLQARVQLKGWLQDGVELDPAGVLALVVLGEARGALPEQVEAKIPEVWKDDIRPVFKERMVILDERHHPDRAPNPELTHVGGNMLQMKPTK